MKLTGRAHGQHLARVADDEHGADRLALAAFPADLGGQVHDGPQRFQRHLRVELAQVLGAEPFQVLAQMDDAQAVDRLLRCHRRLDAVVEGDDVGPVRSFSLATASSRARLMRSWVGVGPASMSRTVRFGIFLELLGQLLVLGGDQQLAGAEIFMDQVPVQVGFGEQQNGVGRQTRARAGRQS